MLKKREAMQKMLKVTEMGVVRFGLKELEEKVPNLIKLALNQKLEKTKKLDKENTFVEISSTGNIEIEFDSIESNGVVVTMIELDTMEIVIEHNLEDEVIILAELIGEKGE